MIRRISRRLSFNTVSLAFRTTALYMGIAIDARIAMIVMTIINSSSVNPLIFSVGPTDLPVFVFGAIQRSPLRFRINIEHILAAPGGAHLRSEEHTSELQSRFDLVC